jgi:hypothetical protein
MHRVGFEGGLLLIVGFEGSWLLLVDCLCAVVVCGV